MNATIVVGQSLRVSSTLGVDVSGSTVTVEYRTPAGVLGSVAATVDTALTGVIHADIPALTLSLVGIWTFFAKAVYGTGGVVKTYGAEILVIPEYGVVEVCI